MSIIQYDGKRIIPSPFLSINKEYTKSSDGQIIGSIFNVSLQGTLVAFKGSPTSSGTWHTGIGYPNDETIDNDSRLSSIERKQEALRDLFSAEGKTLWVQALDATTPISGFPRVITIDIPAGQWYDTCPYTVNMEIDKLGTEDTFTDYIRDAQESWAIETDERPESIGHLARTYRLSHSVSATGKRRFDGSGNAVRQAWHEAENWVKARLGFDNTIALSSGINNLPSYYHGYNCIRTENIDERAGSYSATENWILMSGIAVIEDFTVTTNKSIDATETVVRIDGTITGFENRNSSLQLLPTSGTRYQNANIKFAIASGLALTRAQNYSGTTLNVYPRSSIVGRNPVIGAINYVFEYDNRPSNLITNAKSEVISISDTVTGGRSFAEIFVLDRTNGPILQDLGTRPSFKRNLNIELVVERPIVSGHITSIRNAFYVANPRMAIATSGTINALITALNPAGIGINACHSDPPQETWDFLKGRYSYSRTWTYVPSG